MKSTVDLVLAHGRIVNGKQAPLYLRIEVEDGRVVRTSLGIEQRPGKISWQLVLHPSAFAWASHLVTNAVPLPNPIPDS